MHMFDDSLIRSYPVRRLASLRLRLFLAAGLCLGWEQAMAMSDAPLPPDMQDKQAHGWRLLRVEKAPLALFSLVENGEAVRVRTQGGVGFLVMPLPPGSSSSRLAWQWRIDATPPMTDLRVKRKDDRPLAVHVFFAQDKAKAGFFGGLAGRLRESAAGGPFSGRLITYVWGGREAAGASFPNPFMPKDGMMRVLRDGSAPLGAWRSECVDIAADYRRLFGEEPTQPAYIALSADTDDQGGQSDATARLPVLLPPDAACLQGD
jgi:Protein of unknown function (DUF3047)